MLIWVRIKIPSPILKVAIWVEGVKVLYWDSSSHSEDGGIFNITF